VSNLKISRYYALIDSALYLFRGKMSNKRKSLAGEFDEEGILRDKVKEFLTLYDKIENTNLSKIFTLLYLDKSNPSFTKIQFECGFSESALNRARAKIKTVLNNLKMSNKIICSNPSNFDGFES